MSIEAKLDKWMRDETARRKQVEAGQRRFEEHVRDRLRDLGKAIDLMLKSMELDEKHHDALEAEEAAQHV